MQELSVLQCLAKNKKLFKLEDGMNISSDEVKSALKKEDIYFLCDEPMKNHTSFRIGGPATILAEPKSAEEVLFTVNLAKRTETPYYVIGNGSNLLVSDEGFSGIIIKISKKMAYVNFDGEKACVGAGALLSTVAKKAAERSLSGLECESGIPGSFGGAVYMNAGAYGGEMKDVVVKTKFLDEDGRVKILNKEEHEFGYRESRFSKKGGIILESEILLCEKDKKEILEQMAELTKKRKEKQPLEYPSCGSSFKRPEGYFAAALIEQAGLKGVSVGGAEVSEKHSGFIINKGDATAKDVLLLTEKIKEEVLRQFGVSLECEMKMLGFN